MKRFFEHKVTCFTIMTIGLLLVRFVPQDQETLSYLLLFLGYSLVFFPYHYIRSKYDSLRNVNRFAIRSDTGTRVRVDDEDDIDGDGRGGDTLRRMGIVD